MAGPILRVPIASGKFHGVIEQARPDRLLAWSAAGCRRPAPASSGRGCAPPPRRTSAGTRCRRSTSPLASLTVLPISRLIRCGEVVGPLAGHQLEGPAQDLAALARRRSRPSRPGRRPRRRGRARVVHRAVGDVGQHGAVGGVEDVEPGAALGVAPLAADEEAALVGGEEIKSVHAAHLATSLVARTGRQTGCWNMRFYGCRLRREHLLVDGEPLADPMQGGSSRRRPDAPHTPGRPAHAGARVRPGARVRAAGSGPAHAPAPRRRNASSIGPAVPEPDSPTSTKTRDREVARAAIIQAWVSTVAVALELRRAGLGDHRRPGDVEPARGRCRGDHAAQHRAQRGGLGLG